MTEAGFRSTEVYWEGYDDDGDGTIGSISDDGDSDNDPAIGNARFVVTMSVDDPVVGWTTVTSAGRSGLALRTMTTILE